MHLRRSLSIAIAALVLSFASAARAEATVEKIDGLSSTEASVLERAISPVLARARDGSLAVTIANGKATVTFTPRAGATVSRTLVLEGDATERNRAVVWLAENLSRDEAAELGVARPGPTAAEEPPRDATPTPEAPPTPSAPPTPNAARAPTVPPGRPKGAEPMPKVRPPGPCDAPMPSFPVSFAILSPLAVPSTPSRTHLAIALGYGQFGAVDGTALGLFGHVRCDTNGLALSAFVGVNGRDVRGASASILHVVGGDVHGVAIAAGLGLYGGDTDGATLGIVNLVRGNARGLVLGAGLNAHGERLEGASIAVANATPSDVEGTQIGVVNVARRVHGLQLGVVNVAERADAAIGVVSLSWSRPIRPIVHASLMRPVAGGVLLEGGRTFSEIGASYSRRLGADRDRFALSVDVGVHLVTDDERGLVLDLAFGIDSAIGSDTASENNAPATRAQTRLGYRLAPRLLPQLSAGFVVLPDTANNPVRIVPDFGIVATF